MSMAPDANAKGVFNRNQMNARTMSDDQEPTCRRRPEGSVLARGASMRPAMATQLGTTAPAFKLDTPPASRWHRSFLYV